MRRLSLLLAEDVHLNHAQFREAIKNYRSKILKVLYFFFPGVQDCLDELQPDCDVKMLDDKILNHLRYIFRHDSFLIKSTYYVTVYLKMFLGTI